MALTLDTDDILAAASCGSSGAGVLVTRSGLLLGTVGREITGMLRTGGTSLSSNDAASVDVAAMSLAGAAERPASWKDELSEMYMSVEPDRDEPQLDIQGCPLSVLHFHHFFFFFSRFRVRVRDCCCRK
jgi:hypothetical protein